VLARGAVLERPTKATCRALCQVPRTITQGDERKPGFQLLFLATSSSSRDPRKIGLRMGWVRFGPNLQGLVAAFN